MIPRDLVARSMSYVTKRERPPSAADLGSADGGQAPISSSFTDAITAIGRAWTCGHRSHPPKHPGRFWLLAKNPMRFCWPREPFSGHSPCDVLTWPQSMVYGQAERIVLQADLRGRLTCADRLQCLPVIPRQPGREMLRGLSVNVRKDCLPAGYTTTPRRQCCSPPPAIFAEGMITSK